MKETTEKVIYLRNLGKSYKEISSITGLSKSNISYTCNKYVLNNKEIINHNNETCDRKKVGNAVSSASKQRRIQVKNKWLKRLSVLERDRVTYMAGLYDGEGNHSGTEFSITNSEKSIVDFVIRFLNEVDANYTLSLYLHTTHQKKQCINYWQYNLDYIRQYDSRKQRRDYSKKKNYGTIKIRVNKPLGLRDALREFSYSHCQI